MKRPILALAPFLVAATLAATVIGTASPLNQFFNVRGQAGNTTQTPIATVLKGTSVSVCGTQIVNGEPWLNLCGGGSVSLSVARFSTVTPAPTQRATIGIVTPTNTPTPSRQPTSTATLSGLQTVTPHPTINPYIVYEYGADGRLEGAWLYCPEACQWHITVENLP